MGRPRREIESYQVYELCMRTRTGLPFVCTFYMKLLLKGIIARVQRDQKVTLCHYLWMANHPHTLIVAKDSLQCTYFYGQVQKQLTDAMKKLLGLSHLNLWKSNGTSVVKYGDAAGVAERIAYIYANPARAGLVDSIKDYPGLSTWEAYNNVSDELDSKHVELCPWIRQPAIPALPNRAVTKAQDKVLTSKMKKQAKKKHVLEIKPNAWMKTFGITSKDDIKELNADIRSRLKGFEDEARQQRAKKKRGVMGSRRLREQAVDLSYQSKSKSIKIFVYALDKKIRIAMIEAHKRFCERCHECYERWKLGDYRVKWPPGAFLPAMPPRVNVFA